MPLLAGGDRDDSSHLAQLAYAAVAIWLGYQGFSNLHRYSAVESNLSSLSGELSLGGEREFRRRFARIMAVNNVAFDPETIAISVDEARDQFVISVPFQWTLDLHWWLYQVGTVLQVRAPRLHYPS